MKKPRLEKDMTHLSDPIEQLKKALDVIEAQRSTLGDYAVEAALTGIRLQISKLEEGTIVGERRQATILFSDLSGYTAMNELLDPEEVEKIMNRIKEAAIWIIEGLEGTVNQFIGDEVVALFGIPHAHEGDPSRAVLAAMELHAMVDQLSEEVKPMIGRSLSMHSGINTGLIVTAVRDDRDGKFGLTGDTVNTGARILAQAKENEILVSPDTQRLISPYFETESMEPVRMKGKAEPMVPHRIVGKSAAQSRIEAAEQRGFTQYVGREAELAQLNACLEKSCRGQGQFVTVFGEAGLGKSRLLYEFRHHLDRCQVAVVQGRCQSYGASTPYLPFLDALRKGGKLGDDDSPRELHEKVINAILRVDASLEKYIPLFLHILSIPSKQYPLPDDLSGEELKQTIQMALVEVYTLYTQHKPLVLILEDWHWVDEASEETLLKLLETTSAYPLMVLVNFRPEYSPHWPTYPFHSSIEIKPATEGSVATMVQSVFGVKKLPEGMAAKIFQHTGGNPLFIEELCDLLSEQETVRIEGDGLILEQSIEQITFPETVQAVIRAKFDQLPNEGKEVLRMASVIGREFLRKILEQVFIEKDKLPPSLRNLKQMDLIQHIEHLPEMTYQFNHIITQEVTYETLLLKQRSLLHRRVAETIETHYSERLEEQYEILARHYLETDEWETALHYLELAGDKAVRGSSLVEARTHYWKALELIDAHQMTSAQRKTRIEISLKWGRISHYTGHEEFVPLLERSLELAQEIGDAPQQAHLNYWLGQRNNIIGNIKRSFEQFSRCVELAEHLNDDSMLAEAYGGIARVHMFEANFFDAIEFAEKAVEIHEVLENQKQIGYLAECLAYTCCLIGDFDRAFAQAQTAIRTAEKTGDLTRKAFGHFYLGAAYCWQSNWAKGIEICGQAIEMADPLGEMVISSLARNFIGHALCMQGKAEQGMAMLNQSIEMMESNKIHLLCPLFYGLAASAHAHQGHYDKAKKRADQALEWVSKSMQGYEGIAFFTLAQVDSQSKPPGDQAAIRWIEKGLACCEERGQRPFLAQGYYFQAIILAEQGEQEKALSCRDRATQLFEQMQMTWWLNEAKTLCI